MSSRRPEVRVLEGITNIRGELIGQRLVQRVVSDPQVTGVIFFGEPNSGKSTVIGDFIEAVQRQSPVPVVVDFLQHEQILEETEAQLGQRPFYQQIMRRAGINGEIFSRSYWDEPEYKLYAQNLGEAVMQQESRCVPIPGKKVLRVIEAFSVNPEDSVDRLIAPFRPSYDRGLSALINYANIQRQRGQFNTLFEVLVQDPEGLKKGNIVRGVAEDADLRYMKQTLARPPANLIIEGIGDSIEEAIFIQETILRWVTPQRAFEASREIYNAATLWSEKNMDKVNSVQLPAVSEEILQEFDKLVYKIKAAYMEDILRRRLGIPEDWGDVVVNPVD